jgi:predicted RNase H-like HicB family nuclease
MNQYLVIIERAGGNYSAYSPDLPGCVATGKTADQTRERMRQAMAMHIEGLIEDGMPIPEPASVAEYLAAA